VEPNKARRKTRRDGRARTPRPGLESLEERQLLAYSPLGVSLPDLAVTGISAPVAAYEGPLTVSVDVHNLGASSITEPFNLAPGAPSSADAPPSVVGVFLGRNPHGRGGLVPIGRIAIPAVPQNSVVTVTQQLTLPPRLRGLPPNGETAYVFFRADETRRVVEHDPRNNFQRRGVPVQIAVGLPDLFGVALDVPPVMQPGDTIAPVIRIANFGTVDPSLQGTFDVDLVASTDTDFGPGDTVLQRFNVSTVPPLSDVPMRNAVLGDVNINVPANVITLDGGNVTLPIGPSRYFIGVVVDPQNQIREISEVGRSPDPALEPFRSVGPPIADFPPAGVVSVPASMGNVFPFAAFGTIFTPGITPIDDGVGEVIETTTGRPRALVAGQRANRLARRAGIGFGAATAAGTTI
jgi:hypothetical protein